LISKSLVTDNKYSFNENQLIAVSEVDPSKPLEPLVLFDLYTQFTTI
jgi:hypothetical protein